MMECYFRWCKYHDGEEHYCLRLDCVAKEDQLIYWAILRKQEILDGEIKKDFPITGINC